MSYESSWLPQDRTFHIVLCEVTRETTPYSDFDIVRVLCVLCMEPIKMQSQHSLGRIPPTEHETLEPV